MRGGDELLGAVRRCWASLWSARAIAYRQRQGFHHERAAVAVVVQRLVPAEVSGILFTANPVTGARDELVINAALGLGEAVVGGLTTPDSFVLDQATLTVRERQTGRQEVETILTERGTTERPLDPDQAARPTLNDAQLARLGEMGLAIERHFGDPQDIEWAYADGRLWVLQARPITNLPPPPLEDVRWEPPFPDSAWWRRQVVENLPEPLSPLFDELYVREGLELSIDAMMGLFRLTSFRLEDVTDRPFFATVNGYAYSRADYKLSWRTAPALLRVTLEEFRILFREAPAYWREHALPAYLDTIERWKAVDPANTPDERLLAGVRELALEDARYWFACALVIGDAKITDALLGRFLTVAAPGRGLTSGTFLRGFPSPTVEAEAELEGWPSVSAPPTSCERSLPLRLLRVCPKRWGVRRWVKPGSQPSRNTSTGTATRSTTSTSSCPRRPMTPCRSYSVSRRWCSNPATTPEPASEPSSPSAIRA